MRRKFVYLVGVLLLIVLSLTAVRLFRGHRYLPEYQGHNLDYWFHQLPCAHVRWVAGRTKIVLITSRVTSYGYKYGTNGTAPYDAVAAIRSIGSDGIPFLLDKLQQHNSPARAAGLKVEHALGLDRSLIDDLSVEKAQAIVALTALQPLTASARSHLEKLASGESEETAWAARAVLSGLSGGNVEDLMKTNLIGDLHL